MWNGTPCPDLEPTEKFPGGITNGAEWYVVYGGMQDYNYVYTNCYEITLELGCVKFPFADQLPKYWEDNQEALLSFIEQVLQITRLQWTLLILQLSVDIVRGTWTCYGSDIILAQL